MRRVVVTGLGAVTPLGVGMCTRYRKKPKKRVCIPLLRNPGIRRTWNRLLNGHCGIVNVRNRDARFADLPCQIAGVVPPGRKQDGGWMASEWVNRDVSILLNVIDIRIAY